MSGFLHRLAAQAIGSKENTLHSLARLPYAIPLSPVHNEGYDGQVATLGTMGNKQHPTATNSVVESDHIPSQNHPRDSFHAENDVQDRENEVIPSSPDVLIDQSATGFTTKPDLEITHPPSVKSRLRQPETSVKNTAVDESFVLDGVIKTNSSLNDSATKFIENDATYPTFTDSTAPPALLPLKNTAHPTALNSDAVRQRVDLRGSVWQSQVEETTEVHVNIGRIEVTAVHEAAPPKRQSAAAAKPMTLDEYLARRQKQA